MKKIIFYLSLVFASSLLCSEDSKARYNAFAPEVTSAIISQHTAQKAAKPNRKASGSNGLSQLPTHKKKWCPEWCGQFALPIIACCIMLPIAIGGIYCKATSSCFGFENDSNNSSVTHNSAQSFNNPSLRMPAWAYRQNTPPPLFHSKQQRTRSVKERLFQHSRKQRK